MLINKEGFHLPDATSNYAATPALQLVRKGGLRKHAPTVGGEVDNA